MRSFGLRFVLPILLCSAALVALCSYTSIALFYQQSTITSSLRENVSSRAAASDLRGTLNTLMALDQSQIGLMSELHQRVVGQTAGISKLADQEEEKRLTSVLFEGVSRYLKKWEQSVIVLSGKEQAVALSDAKKILHDNVLLPCREVEAFNDRLIDTTTSEHERILSHLAWGMATTTILGAIAGILFGYMIARLLSRSIRKLRIQIHDATWKLGHTSSEIEINEKLGFGGLHEALETLDEKIVATVGELHEREREIIRAEQLASLGKLAAGVGHELRNPLTSVKMLVQAGLEQDGLLTRTDLHVIEAEIKRMERSLQNFLEFAKLPSPERKLTSLESLMSKTLELITSRAKKQRVMIDLEMIDGDQKIVVDARQLQQVFLNLAINALDAMPSGGKLVLQSEREKDHVRIDIVDNGCGISPEVIPVLFVAFSSTKETGLGLGLVICRRIIEQHGGEIFATSSPGGGATFSIRLPINPDENGE